MKTIDCEKKIALLADLIECLETIDVNRFFQLRGAIHYYFCNGQELKDEVVQIIPHENQEAIHQTLIPLKNAATFSRSGIYGSYGNIQRETAIMNLTYLKNRLIATKEELNTSSNNAFIKNLLDICERLHRNYYYLDTKENNRNDYVRDNLQSMNYFVKDQSRQGESPCGRDAGELDLFVCQNSDLNDIIIEGFNLKSCDSNTIKSHYEKMFVYDKTGNPLNILLIYANVADISTFAENYKNLFEIYNGEHPCESINFENYTYSNIKVLSSRHKINSTDSTTIKHLIVQFNKK